MRFRQRAAEHGEVLGEQIDRAAVDRAPAGDHAVAGDFLLLHANSDERCSTNMSNSSNEPLSSKSSMRSRAVSLPRLCWASMRFSPPPRRASSRRFSSLSRMSFMSPCPESGANEIGQAAHHPFFPRPGRVPRVPEAIGAAGAGLRGRRRLLVIAYLSRPLGALSLSAPARAPPFPRLPRGERKKRPPRFPSLLR